jgi:hypothetical protein
MNRKSMLKIGIATVSLAVSGGLAISAQDKYTVKVPGGLAFSGYCQLNSRRNEGRDSGKESRFVTSSINHCLDANRLFPQTESRFHYCSVSATALQMSPHSEV